MCIYPQLESIAIHFFLPGHIGYYNFTLTLNARRTIHHHYGIKQSTRTHIAKQQHYEREKKIAREGPKEKNQIGEACTYEMCGFGEMNGKILKLKDHLECVGQVFLTSFSFVQLNFEIAMACSTIGIEMVQRFYFFINVVIVVVAVVFHFAI